MRETSLFIISGPSGVGKSTLVRKVRKELNGLEFSVSHTTRSRRLNEVEGKDYYFVSHEEFEKMIKEDRFVEWAVVHGEYYGTSKREIEKKAALADVILDIDVQGAQQIKERMKRGIFIFIFPPSFEELKKRLSRRGETVESLHRRLETARKELRFYAQFDYLIINDDLKSAVTELKAVILATRCSLEKQTKNILPILQSFMDNF
ncbi:MAG: guanylate kinase [Candidatus Aminicenantes bacterium 4484_214]|nr:MAG: guanylate kinase [Candidatus Aminicenantes bacterium 4484_214]